MARQEHLARSWRPWRLIFRIANVRCGRWGDAAAVAAAGKPDQEFLTAKDAKHAKNQGPI